MVSIKRFVIVDVVPLMAGASASRSTPGTLSSTSRLLIICALCSSSSSSLASSSAPPLPGPTLLGVETLVRTAHELRRVGDLPRQGQMTLFDDLNLPVQVIVGEPRSIKTPLKVSYWPHAKRANATGTGLGTYVILSETPLHLVASKAVTRLPRRSHH